MLFQFDVTQTSISFAVEYSITNLYDLKTFTSNNIPNGVIGSFKAIKDEDLAIGAYCVSFDSTGFSRS